MKKIFSIIIFFIIIALFVGLPALAHSGGTDSKGGHYDHSTGEYHYHHGYSAHQHENGECPYSSNSASSDSDSDSDSDSLFWFFVIIIVIAALWLYFKFKNSSSQSKPLPPPPAPTKRSPPEYRVDPRLHPDRTSPSTELLQVAQYYTSGRDNFEIIATNIAMFYYALKETPIGQQIEDECAQFCAVLFDCSSYINEGTIKEADLMEALMCSEYNVIVLNYIKKSYEPLTCPHHYFVQLIMQIEALILHADSPSVEVRDILDAVVAKKNVIAKSVNDVLTQKRNHPLYPALRSQVSVLLQKQEILDMINTANSLFTDEESDSGYYTDLK